MAFTPNDVTANNLSLIQLVQTNNYETDIFRVMALQGYSSDGVYTYALRSGAPADEITEELKNRLSEYGWDMELKEDEAGTWFEITGNAEFLSRVPIEVDSVSPSIGNNIFENELLIEGQGYTDDIKVYLRKSTDSSVVKILEHTYIGRRKLTAKVPTGLDTGKYDLVVEDAISRESSKTNAYWITNTGAIGITSVSPNNITREAGSIDTLEIELQGWGFDIPELTVLLQGDDDTSLSRLVSAQAVDSFTMHVFIPYDIELGNFDIKIASTSGANVLTSQMPNLITWLNTYNVIPRGLTAIPTIDDLSLESDEGYAVGITGDALSITSIDPSSVNYDDQTMSVIGNGFASGMQTFLVESDGTEHLCSGIQFISESQLSGERPACTKTDITTGLYSVKVKHPTTLETATKADGYRMKRVFSLSEVTPNSVSHLTSFNLTITGKGFNSSLWMRVGLRTYTYGAFENMLDHESLSYLEVHLLTDDPRIGASNFDYAIFWGDVVSIDSYESMVYNFRAGVVDIGHPYDLYVMDLSPDTEMYSPGYQIRTINDAVIAT